MLNDLPTTPTEQLIVDLISDPLPMEHVVEAGVMNGMKRAVAWAALAGLVSSGPLIAWREGGVGRWWVRRRDQPKGPVE